MKRFSISTRNLYLISAVLLMSIYVIFLLESCHTQKPISQIQYESRLLEDEKKPVELIYENEFSEVKNMLSVRDFKINLCADCNVDSDATNMLAYTLQTGKDLEKETPYTEKAAKMPGVVFLSFSGNHTVKIILKTEVNQTETIKAVVNSFYEK